VREIEKEKNIFHRQANETNQEMISRLL